MATHLGTRRTVGLIERSSAGVLLGCALQLSVTACEPRAAPPVYVAIGPEQNQRVEFRPVSSYAEYVVFPGRRRELKITLANYGTSCDVFVPPREHDSSVTVTVVSPSQIELGPGSYAWAGEVAPGNDQPGRPYALPTVRLGHVSAVLPPGGEIQLESVATTQDGRVRGMLGFEFPGDAEHVATSLKGSFEAKWCRLRL